MCSCLQLMLAADSCNLSAPQVQPCVQRAPDGSSSAGFRSIQWLQIVPQDSVCSDSMCIMQGAVAKLCCYLMSASLHAASPFRSQLQVRLTDKMPAGLLALMML